MSLSEEKSVLVAYWCCWIVAWLGEQRPSEPGEQLLWDNRLHRKSRKSCLLSLSSQFFKFPKGSGETRAGPLCSGKYQIPVALHECLTTLQSRSATLMPLLRLLLWGSASRPSPEASPHSSLVVHCPASLLNSLCRQVGHVPPASSSFLWKWSMTCYSTRLTWWWVPGENAWEVLSFP